jgi:hypothetical protein
MDLKKPGTRWAILVIVVVIAVGLAAAYQWAPVASGVSCPKNYNGNVDLTKCANTYAPLSESVKCVPASEAPGFVYLPSSIKPGTAGALEYNRSNFPNNPSTDTVPPVGQTECANS